MLLAISSYAFAQDLLLPEGWREPISDEISDDHKSSEAAGKYLEAVADFDGDGRVDVAKLIVKKDESKTALLVFLNREAGYVVNNLAVEDGTMIYMGIDVVMPGKYKTACSKGYWECGKDEPEGLVLDNAAINYFTFGSANSYFYFDKTTGKFKRAWISD